MIMRSGKSHDYRDVAVFEKLLRVLKMASFQTKTQSRRFQIPPVWRAFSRVLFSWRVSTDGMPNHRNKTTISNFSCAVWRGPQSSGIAASHRYLFLYLWKLLNMSGRCFYTHYCIFLHCMFLHEWVDTKYITITIGYNRSHTGRWIMDPFLSTQACETSLRNRKTKIPWNSIFFLQVYRTTSGFIL